MDKIILYTLSNSNTSNIIIDSKNNFIGIDNNNELISTDNKKNLNVKLGKFKYNNNQIEFKNLNKKAWFKYNNEKIKLVKGTILLIGKTHFYVSQVSPHLILKNVDENKKYKIKNNSSIGRDSKNQININDPNISKNHATISKENNNYFIEDTNSSNGIIILPNRRNYPISFDNTIQIGGVSGIVSKFQYGISHDIGRRPTFEDTYKIIHNLKLNNSSAKQLSYFAVFDGHSGKETSTYAQMYIHKELENQLNSLKIINDTTMKKSLKKAVLTIDKTIFLNKIPSGTTANICVIYNNKIYTVNVGDSRSVLSRNGKAIPLSFDHKPYNKLEMKRITESGGFVHNKRVNGRLAVSRAIGDNSLKHINPKLSPLTATPEITITELQKDDEFIVIACDGLWDVMDNQEVVDYIRKQYKKNEDLQLISKNIVYHAINNLFSGDNVTCLIIKI